MRANVGDRIVIRSHHIGELQRECLVAEVHGTDGAPPYVVQWKDGEHETLFFPGPDAEVVRTGRPVH